MKKTLFLFFPVLFIFFLFSCRSGSTAERNVSDMPEQPENTQLPPPEVFRLTFTGDIMAHSVNFRMDDYSLIYDDIKEILRSGDITFGNLETPVHQGRPYETYPTFNIQPPYADAAVNAGVDVFSVANNHCNDQGIEGIQETLLYLESRKQSGLYSAGLKKNESDGLSYCVIEKDGLTVLFTAVTEILNTYGKSAKYVNYIAPTDKARADFKNTLAELRKKHPCDLFVVSIHVYEPEYVLSVPDKRREYFRDLLDCGADIIWGHHPHVMQEWETVRFEQTGRSKLILYSTGNLISGQRYSLNMENPGSIREYTGDAYIIQATVTKEYSENGSHPASVRDVTPVLVTSFTDSSGNTLVKRLTEDFISSCSPAVAEYYEKRLEFMKEIKGTTICR